MDIHRKEISQREKKNFASIFQRLDIAKRLERNGILTMGKHTLTLLPGHLVKVTGSEAPTHPISGYPLDNPMTWDSFVHIYLLDKGDN